MPPDVRYAVYDGGSANATAPVRIYRQHEMIIFVSGLIRKSFSAVMAYIQNGFIQFMNNEADVNNNYYCFILWNL